MDKSFQLDPSSDSYDALEAGLIRDINVLRALAVVQLNVLSTAYANMGIIIGVISPADQQELKSASIFSLNEAEHIINVAFGDEKVYPSTQGEEDVCKQM